MLLPNVRILSVNSRTFVGYVSLIRAIYFANFRIRRQISVFLWISGDSSAEASVRTGTFFKINFGGVFADVVFLFAVVGFRVFTDLYGASAGNSGSGSRS
eukprot:GEMP01128456.1.p2 GENE.GEMP01128456.1~~GEMP01128456.1.p2  ORF type:complete len:100 (-),score=0.02 GEMP01128456.1:103-402(-)